VLSVAVRRGLVAFLFVCVTAGPARAAVAHVASTAAAHGSTTNTVAVTRAATSTSNLWIVMGCHASNTSTMAIANTPNAVTWNVALGAQVTDTTEGACQLWWAVPPNTSTQTITVSCGACAAAFMSALLDEFSGTSLTTPIDATNSNHNTTTGGCNVSLGVTAVANNTAVWSGCLDSQTATATGTASCGTYTGGADDANQDGTAFVIRTGGAGVSCTMNHTTGTGAYIQIVATIAAAAAGGTTDHKLTLLGVGGVLRE
jgi:hypothetical protein